MDHELPRNPGRGAQNNKKAVPPNLDLQVLSAMEPESTSKNCVVVPGSMGEAI